MKKLDLNKKLILAPMAGISNTAYRSICRDFGADITVGEMVSAKALWYGDKKSLGLLKFTKEEQPCIPQIFGSDPVIMAESARKVCEITSPVAIDINMGCPVTKIVCGGDGSALMKNPELIEKIVKCVCGGVDVPVTVKMRSGWDETSVNAVECALAAQSGGASAITVHGRTRSRMYAPPVDLEIIRKVKEAVSVPVIGNGDIKDGRTAEEMYRETGCDSIMVGRAALGNPFIFSEIKAFLDKKEVKKATLEQKMAAAKRHCEALVKLKGEHIGVLEARGQLAWYVKDIRGAAAIRARATSVNTLDEVYSFIESVLEAAE